MNFLEAGALGAPGKTLGIRPEHLELSRETGRIPGTISHVEHLGGETNVYVRTDHHGLLTVRRFGEHRFGVEETVHLTPDPARAFHFGDDGRRLAA
jgi:multiple sugar transport system ATP-binding protein